MAFTQEVVRAAVFLTGGKCECIRQCSHHRRRGMCGNGLGRRRWWARRKVTAPDGDFSLSSVEIVCTVCHKYPGPHY